MLAFDRNQRLVTAMTWIDIESDDAADSAGGDADVEFAVLEPAIDDGWVLARVPQAVGGQLGEGMFRGRCAVGPAAGTYQTCPFADRPVERQDRQTPGRVTLCVSQSGVHGVLP